MRFLSFVVAFAMVSLSLAAPVPVPEPQGIAVDSGCGAFVCTDIKRNE